MYVDILYEAQMLESLVYTRYTNTLSYTFTPISSRFILFSHLNLRSTNNTKKERKKRFKQLYKLAYNKKKQIQS